jgi:predicted DCC family thiol-disulfide oxidoreductase YuxK
MGSPDPLIVPVPINLILFDGVCNLCNGAVQFIIKRDPKNKFRFASLQSEVARTHIRNFQHENSQLYSILLIKDGKVYDRSSAILEIARELSGAWPLVYMCKIIPRFIRDAVYGWIAKNRYRFFGKTDVCMIPTPELKARFVE